MRRDDDVIDALRYVCMSDPVKPEGERDAPTGAELWMRRRLAGAVADGAVFPGGPGMFN